MRFIVSVYENTDEVQPLQRTYKVQGLNFTTQAFGGFGTASFSVPVRGQKAVMWFREALSKHLVIHDVYGNRVYEGIIENTDATSQGVQISANGYYAASDDYVSGLLYPNGTPKSISDIVKDQIQMCTVWQQSYVDILDTTKDVSPRDFTGDAKVRDAIEDVIKFGSDDAVPVPLYFAVWDERLCSLYKEPGISATPDWEVSVKGMDWEDGFGVQLGRADIWNKIQVLYDKPKQADGSQGGPRFTDWYEDKKSQARYGIRVGSLSIGSAEDATAVTIAEMAIASYAWPKQTSRFAVSAIKRGMGGYAPLWIVRAGGALRIKDFDPSLAQLVMGDESLASVQGFIARTSYDADSNKLTLEMGNRSGSLDIFLGRLGLSGGMN